MSIQRWRNWPSRNGMPYHRHLVERSTPNASVWVPIIPSAHAACEYSSIGPPSRPRGRPRVLRRIDIGHTGAESWTVLADLEGNEFCVVRQKETLIR